MWHKSKFGMASLIGSLAAVIVALQQLMVATPMTASAISPVDEHFEVASTSRSVYEPLYPVTIGTLPLLASVAKTPLEREHGLSGTALLPADITKLFVFDTSSRWGFWMKDMNYAIDILWLDDLGRVVYMVASATPESYPGTTFVPPTAARYVLETVSGFTTLHHIATGTIVTIPAIP